MIGNGFYWKNQNLMFQNSDFRIGISSVDWRNIKTSDDKIDLIGKHGAVTGPTFARGRSITIEGYIIASTRAKTSKGMDRLDALFSLQGQLGYLELYEFKAIDEQGREWTCQSKVDQVPEYSIEEDNDHNDGSFRRFRVSLFAPDPKFYSSIEQEETGNEGDIEGFTINDDGFGIGEEGFPLLSLYNEITILGTSTSSPAKITIQANDIITSPLTIYNASNSTAFYLDIDGISGDTIIIDSSEFKVTKNGVDITSQRMPGSSRPSIQGVTQIVAFDRDGGIYGSDFSVSVKYRDALL